MENTSGGVILIVASRLTFRGFWGQAVKKRAAVALIAIGFLLLLPGALWLFTHGLSSDDAAAALSPLARIPLDQLETAGSAAVVVTIPDNPQWIRIRHEWGEPEYLIAAVENPRRDGLIHCLDELGIRVTVTTKAGQVSLKTAQGWPYGYRGTRPQSGLELEAKPGTDLTVRVSSPPRRMPAGELVLMCYWQNVKDKLVGIGLDEDLLEMSRVTKTAGILLIIAGMSLLMRRTAGKIARPSPAPVT